MDKKPNLFVVGAAKAGTTSIYHYLEQHPDIYMSPIKEAHFFSKDIRCRDFKEDYRKESCIDMDKYLSQPVLEKKHIAFIEKADDYIQLYRDVNKEIFRGETSTGYLYSKVAARKIYDFNPDAKIIMVLRNPVERAFSHWLMDLRGDSVYRKSFIGAIENDQKQKEKGWGRNHLYIELGLYYEQVKRYLDIFPREQILILLYDDLKKDQLAFFDKIFKFLNVQPINIDTSKKHNTASIPKYPFVNSILKKMKLNEFVSSIFPKTLSKKIKSVFMKSSGLPKLTQSDRKFIINQYFKKDIKQLEELIERDLSNWYS